MNLSKDPVLRKRVTTMVNEIYEKAVIPVNRATSLELTSHEKKAIDRCVVKYLETSKYVALTFKKAYELSSKRLHDAE